MPCRRKTSGSKVCDAPVEYTIGLGGGNGGYKTPGIPHAWLVSAEGKVVWQGNPGGLSSKLIEAELTYITSHARLSRILFRELLAGGHHILAILEKFPLNNYQLMRQVISSGVAKKELRHLDLDLAPISLMGMIVVFQVFRPVIARVLEGPEYNRQFIRRLSRHTADLFLHGALRKPEARKPEKRTRKEKR